MSEVSNKLLAKAISIAARVFENKFDKSGEPYILHCLFVMNKQTTTLRKILGVLHDVPEDSGDGIEETLKELMEEGFPLSIILPLRLLSHNPEEKTYEQYIRDLSSNDDTTHVKLADLEHNLSPWRLKGLTKKDHERIEKYHTWYVYLSKRK